MLFMKMDLLNYQYLDKMNNNIGMLCYEGGDHASTHQVIPSMEQWRGVLGEEAVQSQLRSSHRNYDTFGHIQRDMMERGHYKDALQCRIKVKELRNAYRKAREANRCSGAAPATCHFYKELDAILWGDPTSTPSTNMNTSQPSSTRREEEEEQQSRSKGAEVEEDTPESLDACSQELFSSQEEGSQSWRLVLGEGQIPEEVPVMQHSSNENRKVQEWQDSERRICQQNEDRRHKSVVLRQQTMQPE
ncbi:unnamed protein product, partial [Natator depressus]